MNKSTSHSKDLHPASTTHTLNRQEIDQQQCEYSATSSRIHRDCHPQSVTGIFQKSILCVIIQHCHSLPYITTRVIIQTLIFSCLQANSPNFRYFTEAWKTFLKGKEQPFSILPLGENKQIIIHNKNLQYVREGKTQNIPFHLRRISHHCLLSPGTALQPPELPTFFVAGTYCQHVYMTPCVRIPVSGVFSIEVDCCQWGPSWIVIKLGILSLILSPHLKNGLHSLQMGLELHYQKALAFTSQIMLCHRTQQQNRTERNPLWVSARVASRKGK